MRPAFLDQPYASTVTPRTGASFIDQACALTVYRNVSRADRIAGVVLTVAVGLALAVVIAEFLSTGA